jgi:flagellar L-ring protein FlgH
MNKPFSSHFKINLVQPVALLVAGFALLPASVLPQSVWREDSKPMYADKRGANIGDILTIVVQESTVTSKDNKTATAKQASIDASIASFLYSPAASGLLTKGGQLPAVKMAAKNDFSGGGTVNNTERIVARIATRVVDVLPNKNLVIEGKRETSFGGEKQTMILRGVVRADDVAANNTVLSYNVADATIQIISKGTITDSQRKGWFTRLWDKITPF